MHVRTDDPRDEYRLYSHRKYDDRFRRKTTSTFDFHRHDDYYSSSSSPHSPRRRPIKRIGNPPFNRFNRDNYSSSYYSRERDLPVHYNDSEQQQQQQYNRFRRDTSPRKDYRSPVDPYNEMYYPNRSERYDIPRK